MPGDQPRFLDYHIDEIIVTVIAFFKWEPASIGRLFSDRIDHLGLYYWYDFIKANIPRPNK
jgi:hypothetical protein